jgi:putative ubiquitin-RnfH superfamily antitoxin RatB of RatAB toxin-antitoxin module
LTRAGGDVVDALRVEVAYAAGSAEAQQVVLELRVPVGCDVAEAVRRSGILNRFPEIQLDRAVLGIYGNRVTLETPLRDGDRVEIYRPLAADPKQARWRRARRPEG